MEGKNGDCQWGGRWKIGKIEKGIKRDKVPGIK